MDIDVVSSRMEIPKYTIRCPRTETSSQIPMTSDQEKEDKSKKK